MICIMQERVRLIWPKYELVVIVVRTLIEYIRG